MGLLHLSLVQADLHWEDPQANRWMLDDLLADISSTDLIVLPEMFATGFTMAPERVAESSSQSSTLEWMRHKAREKQAVVTGSLAIEESGRYVNRLYWVTPEGGVEWYDKRHLFRMGEEPKHYSAGDKRVIVELKGFKILLSVCYDLRFPVWNRNIENDYDLFLCVANWPGARRKAWRTLLEARAIENQCYVAGVNRCGTDGNGLHYTGDSMLLDYLGETLIDAPQDSPFVRTGVIGQETLESFRAKFPAWKDSDGFTLHS